MPPTAASSNLDPTQVNCTCCDALGRDDEAYLAARAIQFFLPGVPQVRYVGLLAGENDRVLPKASGVGRGINRHPCTAAVIEAALQRPVVQRLCALLRPSAATSRCSVRLRTNWCCAGSKGAPRPRCVWICGRGARRSRRADRAGGQGFDQPGSGTFGLQRGFVGGSVQRGAPGWRSASISGEGCAAVGSNGWCVCPATPARIFST
ncbi:MAG: hypothetical protein RL227_1420 [Pseudomonadota bacterium]